MPGFIVERMVFQQKEFKAHTPNTPLVVERPDGVRMQVEINFHTRAVPAEAEPLLRAVLQKTADNFLKTVGNQQVPGVTPSPQFAAEFMRDTLWLRLKEKGVPEHLSDRITILVGHQARGPARVQCHWHERKWEFIEPIHIFPSERLVNELLMLA